MPNFTQRLFISACDHFIENGLGERITGYETDMHDDTDWGLFATKIRCKSILAAFDMNS